jgi:hypothetical protein
MRITADITPAPSGGISQASRLGLTCTDDEQLEEGRVRTRPHAARRRPSTGSAGGGAIGVGVLGGVRRSAASASSRLSRIAGDRSPSARRWKLALGLVIFVGVLGWAVRGVATAGLEPSLAWLALLAVVGSPVMLLILAAEQHAAAMLGGAGVTFSSSARTAVLATSANFLPLPGAALVRVEALRRAGAGTGTAIGITTAIGIVWLAMTGVLMASVLPASGHGGLGILLGAASAAVLAIALVMVWRRAPGRGAAARAGMPVVVGIKVVVHAVNTFAALRAIGFDPGAADAVMVSAAAVLASAVGFFPGGLGLRESLAGGLAATIGVPAAVGSLAAIVGRAVEAVLLAAIGGILLVRGWSPGVGSIDDPADESPSSPAPPRS